MLLLKTAFKNIVSNGKRAWLNVIVLSFCFGIMVLYASIVDGFVEQTQTDARLWEYADGQIVHPSYDRFDVFTLTDAHGKVPKVLTPLIENKTLEPILAAQASFYPNGRMQNVQLKGIDPKQTIIKIPTQILQKSGAASEDIPVLIGKRMAKSAKIKKGDRIMLRWRDAKGVFDARKVFVADIFDTTVMGVDAGVLWVSLPLMQELMGMQGEATYLLKSAEAVLPTALDGWRFLPKEELMADLILMAEDGEVEMIIITIILLSIALLAVFDTQMLSIFRRQKEIGTYIALGMTPKGVMLLFSLEGTLYSVLALLFTLFWGIPFFHWYADVGFSNGEMAEAAGIPVAHVIYPKYNIEKIGFLTLLLLFFSAWISYLPTRRIARQSVVMALKGKGGF